MLLRTAVPWVSIISVVTFLAVWEGADQLHLVSPVLLSSPSQIFVASTFLFAD